MGNNARPIFRFQNLGPVKDAELELGDLTILAGRNNTGKTYIAYALYGFLNQFPSNFISAAVSWEVVQILQFVKETGSVGTIKLPTDPEALLRLRKKLIDRIARVYSEEMVPDVFSAEADTFKNAALSVHLGDPPDIGGIEIEQFETSRLSLKHENGALVMSDNEADSSVLGSSLFLAPRALILLFPELLLDPFILTSERFGSALFHRELDFAKNELVRMLQKMESNGGKKRDPYLLIREGSSRYARPIQDNIHYTRDIPDKTKKRSALYERKRHDDIKRMMQGYYRVVNGGVRLVSTARKEGRFDIPLHQASSSARGLSDMYFYLRHAAQENQLLIIDEPETHLDTANQVEMARLLARLARSGVKVLITTHSDYIVKEINNLIMLSRSFKNKEAVVKELKYSDDDYLEADQVRAYVAEKNGLTRCKMNEYGIEFPVFDETIHEINHRARTLSEYIWADQDE